MLPVWKREKPLEADTFPVQTKLQDRSPHKSVRLKKKMTSVCDWCPQGISKEEKIHRGRPPSGETAHLLGNPLRQRRWRNLDSNYVENPCWFAKSGQRETWASGQVGEFHLLKFVVAWVGSTFRFLPSFFFFFGGRTTSERAPSLHFAIRRGELPGWACSAPQSGRRCEQRPGLPVQRQREGVSRHAGQWGEPARHCQWTHHRKRQQRNAGP